MQRRKFIQSGLLMASLAGQGEENKTVPVAKSFVVKNGQDRFNAPIKYQGISPNLVKISGKDTGGTYAVFEYEGLAKMGPDLHVHLKQDESFYVLEGEYLFQVGQEKHRLTPGDTIFLPRLIPHTWLQLSDRGKLMYTLQPAGKMEEFFIQMNSIPGIPTREDIIRVHLAHDLKIVGPPLTAE
jgi:quercetin dioxygenase-like cupin family protein